MKVFKRIEWVSGTYEYEMPLNENLMNEINDYCMMIYIDFKPITVEDLEHFAAYDRTWKRFDEKYIIKGDRSIAEFLGEIVYEYIMESIWDYQVGEFDPDDTFENDDYIEEV